MRMGIWWKGLGVRGGRNIASDDGNIVFATFLAVGTEEAFCHGFCKQICFLVYFFFPSPISSGSLTAQLWC